MGVLCLTSHVKVWWCTGDGARGQTLLPRCAQDPAQRGKYRGIRDKHFREIYWGKDLPGIIIIWFQ